MAAWPTLPGLGPDVEVEPIHDAEVFSSLGGKEYITARRAVPKNRYTLRYSGLRTDVMAPSPLGAYSEVAAIRYMLNVAVGQYGTHTITDPIDGTTKTVRFDGNSVRFTKDDVGWWSCEVTLIEVL